MSHVTHMNESCHTHVNDRTLPTPRSAGACSRPNQQVHEKCCRRSVVAGVAVSPGLCAHVYTHTRAIALSHAHACSHTYIYTVGSEVLICNPHATAIGLHAVFPLESCRWFFF